VLDAGALIAIETGRLTDVLSQAHALDLLVRTSGGAVAQAWRGGPRSARLAALLKRGLIVVAIDAREARRVGEFITHVGRRRAAKPDVVDAHTALLARETRSLLYTSDPRDMAAYGLPEALIREV